MSPVTTLLPDSLRKQHAENLKLGCGNFLHVACAVSPFSDQQHLWMDAPCKTFTGATYSGFSLLELRHVVDTYASWYYGVGVRPKEPVGVYVGEGIGSLIHYLALNAIGAIPAVVNGNMPSETAAKWFAKVGVTGIYSDKEHAEKIAPYLHSNNALRFFVTDDSAAKVYRPQLPPIYPFQHSEKDTVLIGHSSGTTGMPKAVAFEHQQFFYGIRYRLSLPFPGGSEKVLSALPHSHSAGIAYVMLAVLSGSSTMVLSSNKPEVVLSSVEQFRPTMVVAFPETYVLLNDSDLDAHDLSSIQLWFNGGDAAHEAHIRRLIEKGHHVVEGRNSPGSIFIDGLGSSEMGFSLFRNVHTATTEHYNRCIGKPLDWVDAAVLDEQGNRLPPYRVGKLGVKSPTITPGYWNDSALTAKSTLNGYFLTGDLFYTDVEGRFFHVDRIPDAIKTKHGTIYSLETEEWLIKNYPEILDCTVVAAPASDGMESAVAIIRLKHGVHRDGDLLLAKLNVGLGAAAKKPLASVFFGELSDFPLGPTGKVLKREMRELFRERFAKTSTPIGDPLHA